MKTYTGLPPLELRTVKLLDASIATGAGPPIKLDPRRFMFGELSLNLRGPNFSGVVRLYGNSSTISGTPGTFDEEWTQVESGTWASNGVRTLFGYIPWIRAYVESYTSGTLTMEAQV